MIRRPNNSIAASINPPFACRPPRAAPRYLSVTEKSRCRWFDSAPGHHEIPNLDNRLLRARPAEQGGRYPFGDALGTQLRPPPGKPIKDGGPGGSSVQGRLWLLAPPIGIAGAELGSHWNLAEGWRATAHEKSPGEKPGLFNIRSVQCAVRVRNGRVRFYRKPGDATVTSVTDRSDLVEACPTRIKREEPLRAPMVNRMAGRGQEGSDVGERPSVAAAMPGMQPSDAARARSRECARLSAGSNLRMCTVCNRRHLAMATG
jgi:hypothetical protein